MKVYGFDIDGVISRSFPKFMPKKMIWFVWLRLFEIKFIWKFYNQCFRRANGKVIRVIREIKNRGYGVVIASGNPNWRRLELEAYFKRINIPYDKMILTPSAKPDFDVSTWKRKVVEKEGCICFLDDVADVVDCINKSQKCRAVRYRNQTTEEVLKELGL